jgi:uncharacterized Zn finger protein
MAPTTITRNCLNCQGTGYYEVVGRTGDNTLLIKCPRCGRVEEVDPWFFYAVPNSVYTRPGKEMTR